MARSTASAREQARKMQQEQERKQKVRSMALRLSVVVVALAVITGLSFWVFMRGGGGSYTEGPAASAANEQGGFTLTSSTELTEGEDIGEVDSENLDGVETNDGSGPPPGAEPRAEGEPPHVLIYTDAACPGCAGFEAQYHQQLAEWVDSGAITLEYRSVEFVAPYSARAANAFACMAEESPENYQSFLGSTTADRMNMDQDGISNEELAQRAQEQYGVDISDCVNNGDYRAFVNYTTAVAGANGVNATPTIYVDDVHVEEFMETGDYILSAVEEYQEETGQDLEEDVESDLEGIDTEADVEGTEIEAEDDDAEEPEAEDPEGEEGE